MPHLAKRAILNLKAETLTIDGQEFPWYISQDGISVENLGAKNEIPTLTLSIFAEDVEVIPKGEPAEAPNGAP